MYQVSVDVGTTGGLELFEKTPHASQNIGDLGVDKVYEFEREFLIEKFDQSAFHIIVHASHTKGTTGDMMSDMFADSGPHNATVVIRCRPLEISIDHMLQRPASLLQSDYLSLWEISHHGFHQKIIVECEHANQEKLGAKLEQLMRSSTSNDSQTPPRWVATPSPSHSPQLHHTFITRTLFNEYILATFFGTVSHNIVVYDMEIRSTDAHSIGVLRKSSKWLSNMTAKCPGVNLLLPGEKHTDSLSDGGMDLRVNVGQMFGLNQTKLSVLHLQKWRSIADTRNDSRNV
jgi:hypothetical protein